MPVIEIPDEEGPLQVVLVNTPPSAPGATGPTGPTGAGVPTGGTIGQILAKNSGTNFDTHWIDDTGGGGGGLASVTTTDTATIDFTGLGTSGTPLSAIVLDGSISIAKLAFDPATQAELDAAVAGAVKLVPTTLKTGAYTAVAFDFVRASTAGGAFAIALPAAPANATMVAVILEVGGSNLTVNRGGSDTFSTGSSTSRTLIVPGSVLWVQYNAATSQWVVLHEITATIADSANILTDTATQPGSVLLQLASMIRVNSVKLVDNAGDGGGTVLMSADYMATAALPALTYSNGSSGVGATLTATANGALAAQDGQTPVVNDVILVAYQAASLQNGLYKVTQVGDGTHPFILTRHPNLDAAADFADGVQITVSKGLIYAGRQIKFTPGTYVVGTTGIVARNQTTVGDAIFGPTRDRLANIEHFMGQGPTAVATVAANPVHVPGAYGWLYGNAGAGSQATQQDSTAGGGGETVPGCMALETGTTTTGSVLWTPANAGVGWDATKAWELYCRVKIPTVSDGTNTFIVRIGFTHSGAVVTNAPTDGIFLEARSGVANWQATARASSVNTDIDTGIAYNNAFRAFLIRCIGDGNVYVFSGTTLVATITAGQPTSAATLIPSVGILKSAGTTMRDVRIDCLAVSCPSATANLLAP